MHLKFSLLSTPIKCLLLFNHLIEIFLQFYDDYSIYLSSLSGMTMEQSRFKYFDYFGSISDLVINLHKKSSGNLAMRNFVYP
jgi:hypothetical protein